MNYYDILKQINKIKIRHSTIFMAKTYCKQTRSLAVRVGGNERSSAVTNKYIYLSS